MRLPSCAACEHEEIPLCRFRRRIHYTPAPCTIVRLLNSCAAGTMSLRVLFSKDRRGDRRQVNRDLFFPQQTNGECRWLRSRRGGRLPACSGSAKSDRRNPLPTRRPLTPITPYPSFRVWTRARPCTALRGSVFSRARRPSCRCPHATRSAAPVDSSTTRIVAPGRAAAAKWALCRPTGTVRSGGGRAGADPPIVDPGH